MELSDFNRVLLLSGLLITVAGMAVVSGRLVRDRVLAAGMLVQGIVLLFVAVNSYFPRTELAAAAVGLLLLYPLWSVWVWRVGDPDQTVAQGSGHVKSSPAIEPFVAKAASQSMAASPSDPTTTASELTGDSK